jgi:DNA (cytosine-5)-methyltransferase 1
MSPREYARLQGVPDFTLAENTIQSLFGFGDGVCVPVIRWIDKNVLTPVYEDHAEIASSGARLRTRAAQLRA